MTKQIESTKATIEALASALDKESRLPYASEPCQCGALAITVADRYAQTVRCKACGRVESAGKRAATIQVRAVQRDGAAYACPCDDALEARIADAKAKPAKDRTATDAALAACPAPVDATPKESRHA